MSTSGDIERLPKRARLKLTELVEAEAEIHNRMLSTTARISGLFKALHLKGDKIDDADRSRTEVEEEIARLEAIKAKQHQRHQELGTANNNIRRFLLQLPPHTALEDISRQKVRPNKGESRFDAVNRIREDVRIAKSDVRKLHHAGPRAADLKRAAKNYVSGLANAGRPTITGTYEKFDLTFDSGNSVTGPSIRSILAWLAPDVLLKRLEDEIDARPVPTLALSLRERNERLAVAEEKLLDFEREEEALIEAAYDEGEQITRRYDADPRAVLGVQIKRKKAVAA